MIFNLWYGQARIAQTVDERPVKMYHRHVSPRRTLHVAGAEYRVDGGGNIEVTDAGHIATLEGLGFPEVVEDSLLFFLNPLDDQKRRTLTPEELQAYQQAIHSRYVEQMADALLRVSAEPVRRRFDRRIDSLQAIGHRVDKNGFQASVLERIVQRNVSVLENLLGRPATPNEVADIQRHISEGRFIVGGGMANFVENTGKLRMWAGATGEVDVINDTIKCMAWEDLTGATTDDEFVGDRSSATEVSSTGYTGGFGGAGRKTLASKALAVDQTNDRAEFDCADITWSSISQAGSEAWVGLSIIKEITNDAASPLLATIDTATGLPLTPNGSDISLTVDAEGLLQNS